jgi:integrase
MCDNTLSKRRERVEPGIYRRRTAGGAIAYEIGWRDATGRQRWRRVPGGIKEARAALAHARAGRARGELPDSHLPLRFEDAASAWWRGRVVRLRPATQSTYAASLAHLRRRFAHSQVASIGPDEVAAYIAAQESAGLRGWTIRGHLAVLSAIFRYSSRHLGVIGPNPVAALDRVERPTIEDERPKRVLGPDELRRLLAAVDVPYRPIFELAAETGCRLGEVLGLVWGDIDLEHEAVTFTQQLDCTRKRAPLKTKRSRRCVEITPGLAGRLRALKSGASARSRQDFVFTTSAGTPHDHRNIGGRVLARAVKRAGLGAVVRDGRVIEPAPTFHGLRHSHGSALIAAGWDIEEVSARLGHSHCGTTQQTYVHAYDQARRSDARRVRLAELYDRPASPTADDPPKRTSTGGPRVAVLHVVMPTRRERVVFRLRGAGHGANRGQAPDDPRAPRFQDVSKPGTTFESTVVIDVEDAAELRGFSEDGRGGFRTCDLSRVKRALSH